MNEELLSADHLLLAGSDLACLGAGGRAGVTAIFVSAASKISNT